MVRRCASLISSHRRTSIIHERDSPFRWFETMKLVQLGCGITGLVSAEHLEKNPRVKELILADSKVDAAMDMAARLGRDKISTKQVDATDPESLKDLLAGSDLVISAIPWFLNRKVIQAALEASVDYIDYSMAFDSVEECRKIDAEGKDRGVTLLTSMGSDPGISDVFARYAADKLDHAESARVMDGDTATVQGHAFSSLWSPVEMLQEVTIPAAVFKDGKISYLPPLSERQIYEFPEPVGPLPVYNTIHEETFLMSRFIEGLEYADFRIAVDDEFARVAKVLRMIGLHSLEPIEVKGVSVKPLDVVVALMPRPVDLIGKVKGHACVVVEVAGVKDGERRLVKVWSTMSHEDAYKLCQTNATGYFVGTGGAIGAEMMISGRVKQKGMVFPEQLPAEEFVSLLPAKHLEVNEEITVLLQ
jgi:saccharopine dehydrogenase (NAD+, L-lysine-forming)